MELAHVRASFNSPEYDGTGWTNRTPANGPSLRSDHLLAYDEWRGRVVLFGGYCGDLTGCSYADTFAWDGTEWTNLAPSLSPLARWSTAWAYSPLERGVVLFGGYGRLTLTEGTLYNDLWVLRYDTSPPSPREQCASGADEDGDGLLDCEDPDCEGLPCATGRCSAGACQ